MANRISLYGNGAPASRKDFDERQAKVHAGSRLRFRFEENIYAFSGFLSSPKEYPRPSDVPGT